MVAMRLFSPTPLSPIPLACVVCGIPAIPAYHHTHDGLVFHSSCCTDQRCLTTAVR